MKRAALPLLVIAALGLMGCAGSDTVFPSLAPRAVEAEVPDPDAPRPAVPLGEPDAALVHQLHGITNTVRAGDLEFNRLRAETETAIERARTSEVGGEAWLSAQQLLTALEAARSATQRAQADLDALATERTQADSPTYAADQAAIAEAVRTVASTADTQETAFARLSGMLPQP